MEFSINDVYSGIFDQLGMYPVIVLYKSITGYITQLVRTRTTDLVLRKHSRASRIPHRSCCWLLGLQTSPTFSKIAHFRVFELQILILLLIFVRKTVISSKFSVMETSKLAENAGKTVLSVGKKSGEPENGADTVRRFRSPYQQNQEYPKHGVVFSRNQRIICQFSSKWSSVVRKTSKTSRSLSRNPKQRRCGWEKSRIHRFLI